MLPFSKITVLGSAIVFIILGTSEGWTRLLGIEATAGIALSILCLAALSWVTEAVPLFVTSLGVLALNVTWLLPRLQAEGQPLTSAAFSSPFFSNVILLFLGGFVLSSAFARYGLDERVAQIVLRRTGPQPAQALGGLMGTTAVLSMWMSNTATTAMMLGLASPILGRDPDNSGFRRAVLLGIPFAANLGGLGTPIGTPPNAIALEYIRQSGHAGPSFPVWMIMVAPSLLLLLALAWILVLRLNAQDVVQLKFEANNSRSLSRGEKLVLAVTLVTVIGWLTGPIHGISSGIIALFPVIASYATGLLDPKSFRQLPWDVLILAGGGMSLGVAVSTSGLAEAIVAAVPENAPLIIIAAAFATVASGMSTFMSNTATANLLIPVALGLPNEVQQPIICVIAVSCSVSMALPITTPPNAMAFGSGFLKVSDMVLPGTILSLAGVLLSIASLLWWQSLGIF